MSGTVGRAAALLAAGAYLVWGAWGAYAGREYLRGWSAARAGEFAAAETSLGRASFGIDRFEASWLLGEVLLGEFDALDPAARASESGRGLLRRAAESYRSAARAAPSSGWPWHGMASVLARTEALESASRPFDLSALRGRATPPTGRGTEERFAALDRAIAAEPGSIDFRDALVLARIQTGDREGALRALEAAGAVYPDPSRHVRLDGMDWTEERWEAFARGARGALGSMPMLGRDQQLLAIAKLDRRTGRSEEAVKALEEAAGIPNDPLRAAEIRYWLGLAREDVGDDERAIEAMRSAFDDRVFRVPAADAIARIERKRGRSDEAYRWIAIARAGEPRDPALACRAGEIARSAGRARDAVQAYRDAVRADPASVRARRGLVESLLDAGDRRAAREEAGRFDDSADGRAAREELERRIEEAGRGERQR